METPPKLDDIDHNPPAPRRLSAISGFLSGLGHTAEAVKALLTDADLRKKGTHVIATGASKGFGAIQYGKSSYHLLYHQSHFIHLHPYTHLPFPTFPRPLTRPHRTKNCMQAFGLDCIQSDRDPNRFRLYSNASLNRLKNNE